MICGQNCADCRFAALERNTGKDIVVNVVGFCPDPSLLDFSDAPVRTFQHRGYSIRFLNFSGEDHRLGRRILESHPDIILHVADSMNLERSLRLTARIIDMDAKAIVALGAYDRLLATGHSLDCRKLGSLIGLDVIALEDGKPENLPQLLSALVDAYEVRDKRHVHVPYGTDIEHAISGITDIINKTGSVSGNWHDRYLAVRLLEDPSYVYAAIDEAANADEIKACAAKEAASLSMAYGEPVYDIVHKARVGFVTGALQETLHHSTDNSDHSITQKIDSVLTSRWLGLPILLLVLLGVFSLTFAIGAYPQHWIETGVSALAAAISDSIPDGWLSSLLALGIVEGVGAVLAFLPNIALMFLFLSLLEDSGYMARAAFLMDKLMHRIGLHGNSFIPMLLGFGCNVPAIMAARGIDDRRDRVLTMLMIPFMSCSARLPVYMLLVGAFFARGKALVMIGIYLLGIVLSILFAFVMKRTRWFRKGDDDYVSELPPYRRPTLRNTGRHIWERVADYLQKITTVILAASVIIWALEYFPAGRTNGGLDKDQSYLAAVGRFMEPATSPLGFDWKMNVCLLTGLPAKEAIVSTMGILYHTSDDVPLAEAMRSESGTTPVTALAFMAFVLLYFPCIATISTLKREAGRRWAVFSVVNSLLLAWVVAFLIFRLGNLL
ncbi:MAG: ferrous iron transport protein B [Bacteroidales bacterium]|nr:ferrous iron transport protein B [Candidatus Cryptobacteroides choladohippi]